MNGDYFLCVFSAISIAVHSRAQRERVSSQSRKKERKMKECMVFIKHNISID